MSLGPTPTPIFHINAKINEKPGLTVRIKTYYFQFKGCYHMTLNLFHIYYL